MDQNFWQDYIVALQFFSQVLQDSPDKELLRALADDELLEDFQEWDCLRPCEGLDTTASMQALIAGYGGTAQDGAGQGGKRGQRDLDQLYLDLHTDHLALFSGPEPKAAPWESVWREKDRLLFGESTEAVANTYLDWGIRIEQAGHEPEDHLGLELAFMCYLLQVMQEDPEVTGADDRTAGDALAAFLRHHVLLWADDCLRTASEAAATPFYAHIPVLCRALVHNLEKDLQGEVAE